MSEHDTAPADTSAPVTIEVPTLEQVAAELTDTTPEPLDLVTLRDLIQAARMRALREHGGAVALQYEYAGGAIDTVIRLHLLGIGRADEAGRERDVKLAGVYLRTVLEYLRQANRMRTSPSAARGARPA